MIVTDTACLADMRYGELGAREGSKPFDLSGLILDIETITRIIRRDVTQESVTYQAIFEEGFQIGLQKLVRKSLNRWS